MSAEAARVVLGALEGVEVPGGCADCIAYQVVTAGEEGIVNLRTYHDETCPWWQAHQTRAQRRGRR